MTRKEMRKRGIPGAGATQVVRPELGEVLGLTGAEKEYLQSLPVSVREWAQDKHPREVRLLLAGREQDVAEV